ncbi:endonuclease/exonuclease/phosphatase family protein [Pseudophaeobacter sp.]|uniref:endonuclease/exonuclease/phosphatase family protein n=1 Tax=Pseudophaeobacter sp. TaxID=1971739 RepID=UPI00329A321B
MSKPMLRLASYNIQKCIGLDLRRKPRRILQVIEQIGAQIVLLQEADKRLAPRPAALPHFVVNEAGWQAVDLGGAGSLGWHGNAILWKGGLGIELTGQGHLPLPGLEPRGGVWASFRTQIGEFRVLGVHLGLTGGARREQVLKMVQHSRDWTDMPVVWAGDFNDWARQPSFLSLAPEMQFLPAKPSFPSIRPLAPLDRIALSKGLKAARTDVHLAQPAHIASDHLPVWVDLKAE